MIANCWLGPFTYSSMYLNNCYKKYSIIRYGSAIAGRFLREVRYHLNNLLIADK